MLVFNRLTLRRWGWFYSWCGLSRRNRLRLFRQNSGNPLRPRDPSAVKKRSSKQAKTAACIGFPTLPQRLVFLGDRLII